MKRLLYSAVLLASMSAQAQDTYLNHSFTAGTDLYGTARYVGMGGATGALGAEMSGISSNPAGIGLFRRSDVSLTAGFVRQVDENINGERPVHGSFDQIGGVFAFNMNDDEGMKYINFAFNYQKKADFNHTFLADQPNSGGLSLSYQMADMAELYATLDKSGNWYLPSALSQTMYDAGVIYPTAQGWDGQKTNQTGADRGTLFQSITEGGVHAFDFNVSGNWNDRFFWGLTVGVDYLRYVNKSYYTEFSGTDSEPYDFDVDAWKRVTGVGANVKLGFIFRPIEESSLRVGFTVETPTFYRLKMDADVDVTSHTNADDPSLWYEARKPYLSPPCYLDYNLRSPWRLRTSLGYTVDRWLALGMEYECALHQGAKVSYGDSYYEGNGDESTREMDNSLNSFTSQTLKSVHGLRVGAEAKLGSGFSLRAGYNYYSNAFKKEAYLAHDASFTSMDVATTAHYMNLGDVNIATLGLGYKYNKVYFDLTYKFRAQEGKFYAFDDVDLQPVNVNLNRHQLFCTLGYKF